MHSCLGKLKDKNLKKGWWSWTKEEVVHDYDGLTCLNFESWIKENTFLLNFTLWTMYNPPMIEKHL